MRPPVASLSLPLIVRVIALFVGSVVCMPLVLRGDVIGPTFAAQPSPSVVATVGGNATLSVTVTGAAVTYQWRKYGQAINGATTNSLTLSGLTPFDAALYDVVVSTGGVDFPSSASRVTVTPPVEPASVLTASTTILPRVEQESASFRTVYRAPDGKVYVSGSFTSLFGVSRPGYARLNADGTLDTNFNPVPAVASYDNNRVYAFAVQSDGRVIIAGDFTQVGGYPRSCLARLNADGSLDRTFVPGFNFNNGAVYALAVQADGKILAGGSFNESGGNLARLNLDGSLDLTLPTYQSASGFNYDVYALVVQADGQIVVAGAMSQFAGASVGYIARLSSTGALDTSYTTAGNSGFNNQVNSLAVQSDGKVIAGGYFYSYGGVSRIGIARLTTTGALDTTFTDPGLDSTVLQVALQSDGAVLVAGYFTAVGDHISRGIARLTSTGARDSTFNTGTDANAGFNNNPAGLSPLSSGAVLVLSNNSSRYNSAETTNVGPLTRLSSTGALDTTFAPVPRSAGSVAAIAPAANGKWMIAGTFTHVNGLPRFDVALLNADGTTEGSFAPTAVGSFGEVAALAVQPDGKVVIGGSFSSIGGSSVSNIARLTATGALDPTFTTGSGFDSRVSTLALQADGKIVVGGSFYNFNGVARRSLARLTATGALDSTFTQTGEGFNAYSGVSAVAVLPDGRIYAGGDFYSYGGSSTPLSRFARFNADGTLDPTFTTGGSAGFNSTVNTFLVQPDGKILVGGYFSGYRETNTGSVARLLADGGIDSSFAPFETSSPVFSLAVQGDGKIVVGGQFTTIGSSSPVTTPSLARLFSSGGLDTSFKVPGITLSPTALQIDASGRLLIAGGRMVFPSRIATGLAVLAAAPSPVIATLPANQSSTLGGSATFTVSATGANLAYQWKRDGVALVGATGSSYTISNAQLTDVGTYSVVASNIFGTVTSATAVLTGSGTTPSITTQPASIAIITGSNASLSVVATGATAYQWRKFGQPILGATNSSYVLNTATAGDASFYDVLVANGLNVTRSNAARVSVAPGTAIQGKLATDRSFPAIFESLDGYSVPNRLYVQPDGSYYIAATGLTSVDGAIRLGLARFSAAGVLDPNFAPEIGGGSINAMARQADGKLIIVGDFYRVNGAERVRLARLNIDGTLDSSFAASAALYDSLYAVAVQADGKILLGGTFVTYGGVSAAQRLVRLNADGTVDTAFSTALGTGFNNTVYDIALHSNGRIYVVGSFATLNGVSAKYLAVLNSDGSRFELSGFSSSQFDGGEGERELRTVVVLPDGKMVVGGYFFTKGANCIMGLNADGSFDSSFYSGSGANNSVLRLRRDSDGTYYASGDFDVFDDSSTKVVHLTATGAVDRRYKLSGAVHDIGIGAGGDLLTIGDFYYYYDTDGERTTARNHFARFTSAGTLTSSQVTRWGSFEGYVNAIVPAPGGKWLIGGNFHRVGGVAINNIVRLNADGTVDATFSAARSPLYGEVRTIVVQGDGKILVGGDFDYYGTESSYIPAGYLLRLNADGTLDSTFNLGSGFNANVTALALQPDGRIIVGGSFTRLNDQLVSPRLVRLYADGSLDTTFQSGTGLNQAPSVIVTQGDEKILVGGSFTSYNSVSSNVSRFMRLQANGVLETAFNVAGDNVYAIALQPNGDIIIGGAFYTVAGQSRAGVARFSAAGVFDATFNSGGLFGETEGYGPVYALALQSDGKIVVGGYFSELSPGTGTQYLARLTPAGAVDSTFTLPYNENPINALALRPDGSLLVGGGNLALDTVYRYALMAITGTVAAPAPVINSSPMSTVATSGGTATFTVGATGSGALSYQWRRNGFALAGQSSSTLTLSGVKVTDTDFYDVVVTTNGASTVSSPARLSVAPTTYPTGLRMDPTYTPIIQNQGGFTTVILQDPVSGKFYVGGTFTWVEGATRDRLVRLNADYTLDTTWIPVTFNSQLTALALQPDGKLLVGGLFTNAGGQARTSLARLNPDGTLDVSFGAAGGPNGLVNRLIVVPDGSGKIVMAGSFTAIGAVTRYGLALLNADGSVDTTVDAALSSGASVNAMYQLSDGKLLIGGSFTSVGGAPRSNLALLNTDGTLDTAFAHTGEVTGGIVRAIVPTTGNKFIIGGDFTSYNGTPINRIARLALDGTLDSAFTPGTGFNASVVALAVSGSTTYATGSFTAYNGTTVNGIAKLDGATIDAAFTPRTDAGNGPSLVLVDSGGQILVGGMGSTATAAGAETAVARAALARFSPAGAVLSAPNLSLRTTGTVSNAFATNGGGLVITGDFGYVNGAAVKNLARLTADGSTDTSFAVGIGLEAPVSAVLQPDGKLVLAGPFTTYKGTPVSRIVRLLANGDLDTSFVLPSTAFNGSTVSFVTLLPGGRLLVGGTFNSFNSVTRNNLLVLKPDGTLDTTFDPGAGSDTMLISGGAVAQPDGKIVVRGSFTTFGGLARAGLVRLNADGTVDHAFDPGTGFTNSLQELVLAPGGKFLAGGSFRFYNGTPLSGFARLTSTGLLDASFPLNAAPGLAPGRIPAGFLQQPDGRIIVRGTFPTVGSIAVPGLLTRFNSDSTYDASLQVFGLNSASNSGPVVQLDSGGIIVGGGTFIFEGQSRTGLVRFVASTGIAPVITSPPVAMSTAFGGSATFSVGVSGQPFPTFQWQRNGENIEGATNFSYTVTSAAPAVAGNYRVVITNAAGSVTSTAVPLSVITRNLLNVYARATVAPGGVITSNFTIEGTQSKTILLIGVGGARANLGSASGALSDPRIVVVSANGVAMGSNDNWTANNASAVSAAATQVGATPGLTATGEGAKDAALLLTLSPGSYRVTLDDANGGGGVAMLQTYDADIDGRPRLVMSTLRATVASGAKAITVGFTLGGTDNRTMVLRALGESLGASNEVLRDPALSLYRGETFIQSADDTPGVAPLSLTQVGARPIANTLDATLVQTLSPGAYTATITPYSATNYGTVLVELFEADADRAAVIAPVATYISPNQGAVQGGTAAFGVVTVAKPAASYQWRKNGEIIEGQTRAVLTLTNVQATSVANYDVVITSGTRTITSEPRTLTLIPEFHTADTNRDHRIDILELTRVIQLYNYSSGDLRTGQYHELAGTEDGFTLGPGTLTKYHSADSNHDGKIDAFELSRVIELYNLKDGTTRTGDYHATLGTEDGFTARPPGASFSTTKSLDN